jgi:hypothetical protein
MAITLSNKTDEQIEKEMKEKGLIPKNTICDFEVLDEVTFGTKTTHTEDSVSAAGNDMIVLVLRVFHGDSEHGKVIIDYITAAMEFKLRHAIAACGLEVKPNTAITAKDFIGKSGKAKIGIQKSKDERYGDKNIIVDYIPKVGVSVEVELDDEIPSF